MVADLVEDGPLERFALARGQAGMDEHLAVTVQAPVVAAGCHVLVEAADLRLAPTVGVVEDFHEVPDPIQNLAHVRGRLGEGAPPKAVRVRPLSTGPKPSFLPRPLQAVGALATGL